MDEETIEELFDDKLDQNNDISLDDLNIVPTSFAEYLLWAKNGKNKKHLENKEDDILYHIEN